MKLISGLVLIYTTGLTKLFDCIFQCHHHHCILYVRAIHFIHSYNLSTEDRKHYLVIYGGSSPDGVMNDTIYAELPRVEDIGKDGSGYSAAATSVCFLPLFTVSSLFSSFVIYSPSLVFYDLTHIDFFHSVDMETIFADFKVLPSSPTAPDRPNLPAYTHYEHGREMAGKLWKISVCEHVCMCMFMCMCVCDSLIRCSRLVCGLAIGLFVRVTQSTRLCMYVCLSRADFPI